MSEQYVEPLEGPAKLRPARTDTPSVLDLDPDYPPELILYQGRLSVEARLADQQRQIEHNHSELQALRTAVARLTTPNA